MDAARNPYAPGAGRRPAALAGRDKELQEWADALVRVESGKGVQPIALYGLRGVGKTVLLSSFQKAAEDRGWIVAKIEVGEKTLREALADALVAPLSDLARPSAPARLLRALKTAVSFKASVDPTGTLSFGLDLTESAGGGADSGSIEIDLSKLVRDLSAAAAEDHIGVALFVDEAQGLSAGDMKALCAAAHEAGQREWPFVLALAGLPNLPRILTEAQSYAERLFAYRPIGYLETAEAHKAILEPAAQEGVTWAYDAAEYVVDQAGGYPYFLQQYGQDAWIAAEGDTVTLSAARIGVAVGTHTMDNGLFRARWDRATLAEKRYLRAMAVDGDAGTPSVTVAERLDRKITSLSPARNRLIHKGLIYAPDHGIVQFTVPHMADFIRRQPD